MNEQLNKFYNELVKDQNAERMTLMFQILTIQIGIVMDECEDIQTSIINLLIDINHGRINPKLLKPSQLNNEIALIKNQLPHKLVLPGKRLGNELKEIYKSMTAKGLIVDSRLVINIEIPLISYEPSNAYKLNTLPIKYKGNMIIPDIKAEYLIYKFDLNQYVLINQVELNKCPINSEDHVQGIGLGSQQQTIHAK